MLSDARRIRPVVCSVPEIAIRRLLSRLLDSLSLCPHQLLYPAAPEFQQLVHLFTRERRAFGRALDFDEAAIAGANNVHVHFGARVFVIFQIKQSRSVNDPDADSGNFGDDWRPLNSVFFQQPPAGNRESDIRAGNSRGARAAVRLQDVAVERDRALAEYAAIRDSPQAAANQSLNLVRPTRWFAAGNLPRGPRMGGTRQHRVLCRDPAFGSLAAQMRWQFVFDRSSADDARVSHLDQR